MAELRYDELDDFELFDACKNAPAHDHRAFETLVRRYEPVVHRICLRLLASESDANDVTQEVFLRVFRHLASFQGRSSLKTWIVTIARNECFSFISKQRDSRMSQIKDVEHLDVTQDDSTGNEIERGHVAGDLITKVLQLLSDSDREIIVLRFVSELSLDEIAQSLDLSLSATKMRLYRAIERFTEISNKQEALDPQR